MPSNDPRQTKAERQAEARARAAQLRAQQERAAKRNRYLAIGGLSLAAIVLIGAFVLVFAQNQQNKTRYSAVVYGAGASGVVAPDLAGVKAPSTANDSGGIPVSDDGVGVAGDGDTVLSVYFDLQCPACGSFDTVNAADLKALSQEPGITILYQPLTFLDQYSSGTYYSTRAANAVMVVADQDPDHFQDFITALYADQPEENSSGLTDDKIGEIAAGVGVPQSVIDQFTATVDGTYQVSDASSTASTSDTSATTEESGSWRTFAPFMAAATAHAQQVLGSISTPTLLLNGTDLGDTVNWTTAGALKSAVEAAAAS